MITRQKLLLLIVVILCSVSVSFAQNDTIPVRKDTTITDSAAFYYDTVPVPARHRIAVFTPLYLDSAFDAYGNYRFDKNFPKYINPGLEFMEGVQLAIDSLQKEGIEMDIHIYDTRSVKNKFDSVLAGDEIKTMNLIIGHVTVNEAAKLARLASSMNIPFINANLPNDAAVTNNPYFVVLNSTLTTHCAGIYKFLQRNFALSNIVVFRKKGATEDRLKAYFTEVEKSTASVPLKLKYVTLPNNFTQQHLADYLDSNITNVCLVGSLDLSFGQNLCKQLATLSSSYTSSIMGMPTWDVIDFEDDQYKGIEIYYSTPFYIPPANTLAMNIYEEFRNNFFSRPSDMVFRGFETLYHFAHLLNQYDKNVSSSLGVKRYLLFNEFDIQPVLGKQTLALDYFENKKLYFIRKVDGEVKAVY